MGNIFDKFSKSKIAVDKTLAGISRNNGLPTRFGETLIDKTNVPFKSNTKAAINPTTDTDDYGMGGTGRKEGYGLANPGGASGDKSVGYPGGGQGISQLDGAHGNDAARKLEYGN